MSKWAKRKDEPERLRGHANIKRRERIALRDGYTCQACKRITDLRDGEADHVVPLCRAGKDEDLNLQWLCKPCHEIKSAMERGVERKVGCGLDGWPVV
jgi:5-methylcytosine-specific restriction protein A